MKAFPKQETPHGTLIYVDQISVNSKGISINGLAFGNKEASTREIAEAQYLYDIGTLAIEAIKMQQAKLEVFLKDENSFKVISKMHL